MPNLSVADFLNWKFIPTLAGCHGVFNVEKCTPQGCLEIVEQHGLVHTEQHQTVELTTPMESKETPSSGHLAAALDQRYAHGGSGNFMDLLFGQEV
jgi:hypothetical protein